ncbi:MAG: NYN domain-containing protein [Actinobacteria bacterium]|nr:NYN domain-containing protein [Actinomycetota bacterium]
MLVPFLQWAGEALREFKAQDVPPALRPLLGFDRRGFSSAAARGQLRRALEAEPGFLAEVLAAIGDRAELAAMLSDWTPGRAVELAEQAEGRDDLPLMASALVVGRPEGWEVGVGVVMALAERRLRERSADDDRRAFETQVRRAEEAQRRAEEEAARLAAEVDRVGEELRAERASRRDREDAAEAAAGEARRRVEELEAELAAVERAGAQAVVRADREAERAAAAERTAREVRAEAARARALEARLESERAEARALSAEEADLLARASEIAHRLVEPEAAAPSPSASEARPSEAAAGEGPPTPVVPQALEEDGSLPRGRGRRRKVDLPPGIIGPSIEGLRAALSGDDPAVIVDGYNVSMLAWGEEAPDTQRQRLCALLERLHLRTNRSVTVVFDGADVEGIRPPRRPGVRVIFSVPGEEADDVVVREVRALPNDRPVIAVSSDRRVEAEVENAGALAVPSDVFLEFLRK